MSRSTPDDSDAAVTSWPRARSSVASCEPRSPVPRTVIFMVGLPT
ncbi:hypothetical protein ACFQ1I_01035 [Kitasatospora arboriphila]